MGNRGPHLQFRRVQLHVPKVSHRCHVHTVLAILADTEIHSRKDVGPNVPWAHQDQDPDRPGLRCLQGLVNLLPNGPEDGGLIIAKGAHVASEEFHAEFAQEERMWAWYVPPPDPIGGVRHLQLADSVLFGRSRTNEFYGYKETGLDWLREKGYDFVKVTAEPGRYQGPYGRNVG